MSYLALHIYFLCIIINTIHFSTIRSHSKTWCVTLLPSEGTYICIYKLMTQVLTKIDSSVNNIIVLCYYNGMIVYVVQGPQILEEHLMPRGIVPPTTEWSITFDQVVRKFILLLTS